MPTIGVTGHRGLSRQAADYTRAEVRRVLGVHAGAAFTGITCLADGADRIFADAVLELGGRLVVIVPADRYRDSLPASHLPDYDRLLCAAHVVHRLDHHEADPDAFMAASRRLVDDADEIIAVWDGEPARGYAGTADVVRYAISRGRPIHVVWPPGTRRR
jgi:hypothetical protein